MNIRERIDLEIYRGEGNSPAAVVETILKIIGGSQSKIIESLERGMDEGKKAGLSNQQCWNLSFSAAFSDMCEGKI